MVLGENTPAGTKSNLGLIVGIVVAAVVVLVVVVTIAIVIKKRRGGPSRHSDAIELHSK
jgi:heme/copper-type cytochrome/quinol oxidase subunit 2